MKTEIVKVKIPENASVIIGHSHFIKTVEDIYEALVNSVPQIKCGVSSCEASGPCLVRTEGTDAELKKSAAENALAIGVGHSFIIFLNNAYPINVLTRIKSVAEVCSIYCATANPVEVIVAETSQGRGLLGIVDGFSPKGIEGQKEKASRKKLLRAIAYKL